MINVLQNPAWHALTDGNSELAHGTGPIRFFDIEISPIVGLANNDSPHLEYLYEQLPDDHVRIVFTPDTIEIPTCWKLLNHVSGYQMVYGVDSKSATTDNEIIMPLGHEHVPQMLSLTQLTKPGPFASQTILFNHYEGIFDGDKLVAMAGQRLHAGKYAEISAVCTHPEYLGRGYARQLLHSQIKRMLASGHIPYLHVRDDNERALNVYKELGFDISTVMHFYIIQK